MDLLLLRTYLQNGTNGTLRAEGQEICRTIELPWKDNRPRVSCIPEGSYRLRKRYSPKFGSHFEVVGVKDRQYILFHPANDAAKELKGCIAPVSQHTGEGRGSSSRAALHSMKARLFPVLNLGGVLVLTIKKAER